MGLILSACQLVEKEEPPKERILHIVLNDSLKKFESVTVLLVDAADTAVVLQTAYPNQKLLVDSLPPVVLIEAKDKPFKVKVRGYLSGGRLVMESLLSLEGGKQKVAYIPLPKPAPRNKLTLIQSSSGALSPAFHPDIHEYNVQIIENTKEGSVHLQAIPVDPLATLLFDDMELPRDSTQQDIYTRKADPLVSIKVVELGDTLEYKVQFITVRQAPLGLLSLQASVGTLNPEFNSDVTEYALEVPAVTTEISFLAEPNDRNLMTMEFRDDPLLPGSWSTPIRIPAGGTSVSFTVYKGLTDKKDYTVTIAYPPKAAAE